MRLTLARIRRHFTASALDYTGLSGIVLGLGNPGRRYAATRHNLGWLVVECLARRAGLALRPGRGDFHAARWQGPAGAVLLVTPTTFMNRSGEAARQLGALTGLAPARWLVIADDLDLPLGRLRLRARGGPGGHNGLASLIETWGDEGFARLRLGIGRPSAAGPGADRPANGGQAPQPGQGEGDTVAHVLGGFTAAEAPRAAALIEAAADAVTLVLAEGLERAAGRVNGLIVP